MSINFDREISEESAELMRKLIGEPAASDGQHFLYDKMHEINQADMKAIANSAKQPVTVELNKQGEIKTMADGRQYEVTPSGWKLIEGTNK